LRQVKFQKFVRAVLIRKCAAPGQQVRAKQSRENTFQDHVAPSEIIKIMPLIFPDYALI
jgi:hypothetical protein